MQLNERFPKVVFFTSCNVKSLDMMQLQLIWFQLELSCQPVESKHYL